MGSISVLAICWYNINGDDLLMIKNRSRKGAGTGAGAGEGVIFGTKEEFGRGEGKEVGAGE